MSSYSAIPLSIKRTDVKIPWGVKMVGGEGTGKPLSISLVTNYHIIYIYIYIYI